MGAQTHVHTVYCPECKRFWTGEFEIPIPETETCRDCLRLMGDKWRESRDIHIKSGRAK